MMKGYPRTTGDPFSPSATHRHDYPKRVKILASDTKGTVDLHCVVTAWYVASLHTNASRFQNCDCGRPTPRVSTPFKVSFWRSRRTRRGSIGPVKFLHDIIPVQEGV